MIRTVGWCLNTFFLAWVYKFAAPATIAELYTIRLVGTVSCVMGIIGILDTLLAAKKVKR